MSIISVVRESTVPPGGLRPARPADYDAIAAVVDDWWERPVLALLPRLFLDHFHQTSLVVEDSEGLAAFLIGLLPADRTQAAYVHFIGVAPRARKHGLARAMYDTFFSAARRAGHHRVAAITSPFNAASIAFHQGLGFTAHGPVPHYNGPGNDMVTFSRQL